MHYHILTDHSSKAVFERFFSPTTKHAPHFILNEADFNSLQPNPNDLLFILAELQWSPEDLPSHYRGFKLVKQIRYSKQWLNPIVMCSFLPQSHYQQQNDSLFKIFNLPHSHAFLDLLDRDHADANLSAVASNIRPLSYNQLKDFVYHFYEAKGLMEEDLHKLKDQVLGRGRAVVDEVFQNFAHLVRNNAEHTLARLKAEFLEQLEQKTDNPLQLVTDMKPRLLELLPQEDQEAPVLIQVPWQILFIDDNDIFRKSVQSKFAACGLSCLVAESGEEAFQILDQDARGLLPYSDKTGFWPVHSINVLISDLRLLYPDSDQWQPLQGYDIIEKVFENGSHFLSFFILTSKKTSVYQEYAQSKVRIQWFAKEDVLPESKPSSVFNSFARQIERAGNNIEQILCSIPSASTWNNPYQNKIVHPLKVYYRHHRLSADYYEQENRLNTAAMAYITEVLNDKPNPERYQFKTGQQNLPSHEGEMEKFRVKLIGRRVVLGLFVKGYKPEDIYEFMCGESASDNYRQFFSTYFALSTNLESLIPEQLLVEEKRFLEQFMQYPINPDASPFLKDLGQQLEKLRHALTKKYNLDNEGPIALGHYEHVETAVLRLAELAKKHGFKSEQQVALDQLKTILSSILAREKYRNAIRISQLQRIYEQLLE